MCPASEMYRPLQEKFGTEFQVNADVSQFTTSQSGGLVDGLVIVRTQPALEQVVTLCWEHDIPFRVLGNASNVLVSDKGYRGVIIINRSKAIRFYEEAGTHRVAVDSGANLGGLARQAALRGLSGLEWASGIPGTVGGALYGNAGAEGQDMQAKLIMADILHPLRGKESWDSSQFEYSYRSSILKRSKSAEIILAAHFQLFESSKEKVLELMDRFNTKRRATQPPGASMGSTFKNPTGDHAGRLIEAAGLKGTRIGTVEISPVHANFFVNHGQAKAADILQLINLAKKEVLDKFNVNLELEIELLGDWDE